MKDDDNILAFPNLGTLAKRHDTQLGLCMTTALTRWRANYSNLLEVMVFPHMAAGVDRKTARHHRHLLDSRDGHAFLDIMWKEGRTDDELRSLGLNRTFLSGCVTAYGLAVHLAEQPKNVAKTNTRIRALSIAASDCGLIKREAASANQQRLYSTPLLNDFMIKLAKQNFGFLGELCTRLPAVRAAESDE